MDDRAVLGDVEEGDLTLVLALVRGDHVLDVKLGVGPVVVDHQLTPNEKKVKNHVKAIQGFPLRFRY